MLVNDGEKLPKKENASPTTSVKDGGQGDDAPQKGSPEDVGGDSTAYGTDPVMPSIEKAEAGVEQDVRSR